MALIFLGGSWLLGIYLGAFAKAPGGWVLAVLLGVLFFALFSLRKGWKTEALGGLCLAFLLLGVFRYHLYLGALKDSNLLAYHDAASVSVKGVIDKEPEERGSLARWPLSVTEVKAEGEWEKAPGALLVYTRSLPSLHYGDLVILDGPLESPPTFDEFDYREYLARRGIYSVMRFPKLPLLERDRGYKPLAILTALRYRLAQSLESLLPDPQASLAQGILLGIRTRIPQATEEAFARTGTTHILAISGHNLSVVAGILAAWLGFWVFGRRSPFYLWGTLFAIWLYATLVGLAPSVVRASIMGSLAILAAFMGRQNGAGPALTFAAGIMALFNPFVLWDVGFQLSFMAMAGLILITPLFDALSSQWFLVPEGGFGEGLTSIFLSGASATLGASLAALPIVAANFHTVPLVSLPATIFALPALAGIIVASALAAVLGLFSPLLAQPFAWVDWLMATYMIKVVKLWSDVPWASVSFSPGPVFPWGYYAILGSFLWVMGRKEGRSLVGKVAMTILPNGNSEKSLWERLPFRMLGFSLALLTLMVWLGVWTLPDGRLHVSFLDVGQGDAILIQTPLGRKVLVDGGPSPQDIANQLGERLPFWDRRIDLVILTHPEADHLTGLVEVLSRYQVGRVMESGRESKSQEYKEWLRLLEEKKMPRTEATAGLRVNLSKDIFLETFGPTTDALATESPSTNDLSLVIRLVSPNATFLLSGDIEKEGEVALLAQDVPLNSTVLKVPHHGSNTSSSAEFLEAVAPRIAIISAGKDNPLGHPKSQTLERLEAVQARVFRTDERGTLEVIAENGRVRIKTER